MAWLAKLDARAAKWPRPAHWLYLGVKGALIVIGAICLWFWYVEKVEFFDSLF